MSMSDENIIQQTKILKEELTAKNPNLSATNSIAKNIILPNIKYNNKTITANHRENKIAIDNIKRYDKKIKSLSLRTHKRNLNKSTTFPYLKESELKKFEEKNSAKIASYSNRLLDNKSAKIKGNYINFMSMRNSGNQINKIKNNFFKDKIKQFKNSYLNRQNTKESKSSKEKTLISKLTKNTNTIDETSKETKNYNLNNSKSTIFKISKINLNKYRMSRINEDQIKKPYNLSASSIPKHSKFYRLSQKDSIGSHTIYKYYLNKSSSEITLPVKNYQKIFDSKNKSIHEKLKRIYCENKNFDSLMRELKDNRKLAYKDDFDIEEYQNTLLEILEKRISQKNLIDLQDDYRDLNKKLFNVFEPKGRYTFLAEKLRYNLPSFLLEKMKKLDQDSIINRMNYYNQFKQFKKDKKLVVKFGRRDETKKTVKRKKTKTKTETDIDNIDDINRK